MKWDQNSYPQNLGKSQESIHDNQMRIKNPVKHLI